MSEAKTMLGVVGLFDDPNGLVQCAKRVKDAGIGNWDCLTPYPVHGLDRAMGLKPSPVGRIALAAGFLGAGLAMLMQWWMSAVDYPIVIGGKPLFSWPAFVPITFEAFVLFTALTTMACILVFCKLGRWHSPYHDCAIMPEVTSDRFALVLRGGEEGVPEEEATRLLQDGGCKDIRPLFEFLEEDHSIV